MEIHFERMKKSYKKSFEDSFVEDFNRWKGVVDLINNSIAEINKAHKKKIRKFRYDDFCKMLKESIDQKIEHADWHEIMSIDEADVFDDELTFVNDNESTLQETILINKLDSFESKILNSSYKTCLKKKMGKMGEEILENL